MNPFHFFKDQESIMQQVVIISLYTQMGHSGKLNTRQCHFYEIHERCLQKELLLFVGQAEGFSSVCQANLPCPLTLT